MYHYQCLRQKDLTFYIWISRTTPLKFETWFEATVSQVFILKINIVQIVMVGRTYQAKAIWYTVQKTKLSIKRCVCECGKIWRNLWICSYLLTKSLLLNLIFCAMWFLTQQTYAQENLNCYAINQDSLPVSVSVTPIMRCQTKP